MVLHLILIILFIAVKLVPDHGDQKLLQMVALIG